MSIIFWSSHSEFARKEMEQMEIMQRKLLRQLQCLSNQVANTAVYVLIGEVPIYMMIEPNNYSDGVSLFASIPLSTLIVPKALQLVRV
jgi:hypothetical protein